MDDDVALFASLEAEERRSLVPARGATLSETLAASSDARMRQLALDASADEVDVGFLLSLLSSIDPAVLEAAADGIWKAAINSHVREIVRKANGSRPLVALLAHAEPRVQRVAAGALSILALDTAQRAMILASGGSASLSAILADGGDREAEQAARAAANLAADELTRASLVDLSAPTHLAALLRRRRSPAKLREAACRALAALAVDSDAGGRAATGFAEGGGVGALVDCLQQQPSAGPAAGGSVDGESGGELSEALVAAGLLAASGGSTSARGAAASSAMAGADDPAKLEGQLVTVVGVAARAELNGQRGVVLTFHSVSGRYHVRLDSGETVRACESGPLHPHATRPRAHMPTRPHTPAREHQARVRVRVVSLSPRVSWRALCRSSNWQVALRPNSVQLLSAVAAAAAAADGSNSPLLRAAVRAARALALHQRTADELVRAGALPPLTGLLGTRSPEIAAAAAGALGAISTSEGHRPAVLAARGVPMLLRCLGEGTDRSVQEPACAALRTLCLSGAAREQLADAARLGPVVAVLSRGDAQAREAAAGLLGSIALLPKGRGAVIAAGAVSPLVKLLPLRHEPTQEAAARALKNIAFDPSGASQVAQRPRRPQSSQPARPLPTRTHVM